MNVISKIVFVFITISRAITVCVIFNTLTHMYYIYVYIFFYNWPECASVGRKFKAKIKLLLSCQLFLSNNFILFYLQHRETNNTSFAKLSAAVAPPSPFTFSIHFHLPCSIYSNTLCFYPLPMLFMTRALSHRHVLKRSAHSLFALSWTNEIEEGGLCGWQTKGLEFARQNCQTFCA